MLKPLLQWELLIGTLPCAQSAVLKEATDTLIFKAALFLLNLLNWPNMFKNYRGRGGTDTYSKMVQ